jgi:hypothetical protein
MGKCCKKKRKRCKSWENHQKPYNGCGNQPRYNGCCNQQTFNFCYNNQICHCCGCCFTPCPPIPPPPMCPPITFPNEPPECALLRDNLDGSTFQRGEFEFIFFENMGSFNDAITLCSQFDPDAHLITVEEINLVSSVLGTSTGSCSTLLWATNNGIPTLAYLVPGSPPIIVPPPSLDCRADTFCVRPAIT